MTLKLTSLNYPLWREQLLPRHGWAVRGNNLTCTQLLQTQVMIVKLKHQNNYLMISLNGENTIWIIGSVTEETLGLVIGLESSQTVWKHWNQHMHRIPKNANSLLASNLPEYL